MLIKYTKKNRGRKLVNKLLGFFYISVIHFNCVKNLKFEKICHLIGKYGVGFKPPSYHEIRKMYLKQEMTHMDEVLKEHKAEWKKSSCIIMTEGWTNKKRRSIINFLVNSHKGEIFLKSVDASDICKIVNKILRL